MRKKWERRCLARLVWRYMVRTKRARKSLRTVVYAAEKKHREQADSLSETQEELEDATTRVEQLQAENDVLKLQVDMMMEWSSRWQSTMAADQALLAAKKMQAGRDEIRPDYD